MKVLGNTEPRYRIGINLGAEWNNIFISAFFQGVLQQDWYPRYDSNLFWGQYNRPYGDIPSWHLAEGIMWTEENPSQDAFLPRYVRSEEHTSELQSRGHLVCRLLLEKKKINI